MEGVPYSVSFSYVLQWETGLPWNIDQLTSEPWPCENNKLLKYDH